jgi:hypothetical protein
LLRVLVPGSSCIVTPTSSRTLEIHCRQSSPTPRAPSSHHRRVPHELYPITAPKLRAEFHPVTAIEIHLPNTPAAPELRHQPLSRSCAPMWHGSIGRNEMGEGATSRWFRGVQRGIGGWGTIWEICWRGEQWLLPILGWGALWGPGAARTTLYGNIWCIDHRHHSSCQYNKVKLIMQSTSNNSQLLIGGRQVRGRGLEPLTPVTKRRDDKWKMTRASCWQSAYTSDPYVGVKKIPSTLSPTKMWPPTSLSTT